MILIRSYYHALGSGLRGIKGGREHVSHPQTVP